jgi:hypothetical protein
VPNLTPNDTTFDVATTERAYGLNPASLPPDLSPPESTTKTPEAPAPPTPSPTVDWATAFFGSLGLPSNVINDINKLAAQYSDPNDRSAAALLYLRGTPWYAQTFPGISEGMAKGLVSNEADYRTLLNQHNQLFRQYLGRDISADEFATHLRAGTSTQMLAGHLQGAALAGTYGQDWRNLLGAFDNAPTDSEVTALGEEQAGLDSPIGQQVQRRLDLAKQRFEGVFKGHLAAPSLSIAAGRLSAPSLLPGKPDIGA